MTDALKARLRKLLALSQQGIGGEKDTAAAMLERMLRKHGIAPEALESDFRSLVFFKPDKIPLGNRLLAQVMATVCGRDRQLYRHRTKPGYGIEVSEFERIEIELRYAAYSDALSKEIERCYIAFLHVNRIFPNTPPPDDSPPPDPEELQRLLHSMRGMTPTPIHSALPAWDGKVQTSGKQTA